MIVQPSAIQRVAAAVSEPTGTGVSIPPLHAPDRPGEAAHAASGFATAVQIGLMIAASPTVELPARIAALEKLFEAWPALCREMSKLSEAAPKSAAVGRARAADLRDFSEQQQEAGA